MKRYNLAYIPELIDTKLMLYFKNNLNLSSEDIENLSIGVTVIIFNIFEAFLVLICSVFLGIIKETIIFYIMFIMLRIFAAGVHCKTGHACIITTFILFIGASLLAKYYPLAISKVFIIVVASIGLLFKYAPADTENRPILGHDHRRKLKIKTVLSASLILFISLLSNDPLIFNCAMYALIIEVISVLPFTYKLLGVNYNNYRLYE